MATPKPPERVTQEQFDSAIRKHRYFSIGKQGGARAVFKFADLSGLDFRGADLSGADFTGSNLSDCNLKRGTFTGAAFYGCNLDRANLEWANFSRADLRGTSREGAKIEGADLTTADLRGGQIFASKQAQIDNQQGIKTIDYSEKNEQRSAYTDLTETDEAARLSAVDLSTPEDTYNRRPGLDLSQSEDTDDRSSDLDLSEKEAPGRMTDFSLSTDPDVERVASVSLAQSEDPMITRLTNHAKWIGSKGARGEQLDISGLDMRSVRNLVRYPLIAVKARGANFSGMHLAGIHMQCAILDDCNFSGANLSGADLRGSSLRGANLTNANLEGANLGTLNFGERRQAVDLTNAIVKGTILED